MKRKPPTHVSDVYSEHDTQLVIGRHCGVRDTGPALAFRTHVRDEKE